MDCLDIRMQRIVWIRKDANDVGVGFNHEACVAVSPRVVHRSTRSRHRSSLFVGRIGRKALIAFFVFQRERSNMGR